MYIIRTTFLLSTAVLVFGLALVVNAEDELLPAPINLTAEPGDSHINLTWERPEGLESTEGLAYWLYWVRSPSDFVLIPTEINTTYWRGREFIGNKTSFTLSNLTNGWVHYFHVRIVNQYGEGEPSNIATARPLGFPSEPRNLEGNLQDEGVHLQWEPPDVFGDLRLYYYRIFRGSEPETMEEIAVLRNKFSDWNLYFPPPTNYTDTDIDLRRVYYYKVVAGNRLGDGQFSYTIKVGEGDPTWVVPNIPRDAQAYVQDGHIKLFWRPPGYNGGNEVVKYRIYRRTDERVVRVIGEVPHDQHTYLDVDTVSGVEYHYAVSAVNVVGEGPKGLEVTASIPSSTTERPTNQTPGDDEKTDTFSTSWYLGIIVVVTTVVLIVITYAVYPIVISKRARR